MTDLEKPKRKPRAKKPPTQTAGVGGIDAHGGMGEAPQELRIDWQKLVSLPAFEMFVFDESGQSGASAGEWVSNRRATMGDTALFELYSAWHEKKGLWANETPFGKLKQGR